MRSLRMPLLALALFFATLPISQAKTNYAYVANNSANTVSVINTATHAVVATIPVGTAPYGVAVNQAGSTAYVANFGSNNVSVITTSTNTVTAIIPVGSGPTSLTFAPNGKTAYVTNSTSNSVSVINTGTKTVTATVAVQNYPYGVAVTPNGAFVYVLNATSASVSVVSTLTNKVVTNISLGGSLSGIAISPDGSTAYVTDSSANTVSVIRTADNTLLKAISVAPGPGAVMVTPDGHFVYVAQYGTSGNGNLVTVIDSNTQTVATTIVVGTAPTDVGFSEDSTTAYVSNSASNSVSVINTASKTVTATVPVGAAPLAVRVMGTVKVSTVAGGYVGDGPSALNAAIGGPYSSVYDSAGNLYISDFFMNRIRKVTPSGGISTYAGTGICGYNGDNIKSTKAMVCAPNGLALDPAGNLIFADSNGRIRKITPSGTITTVAGNGVVGYSGDGGPALNAEIGQPYKLAYDSTGNLYFDQVGNCVVRKVDTTGKVTTFAGTGTCGYNGDGILATSAQLNQPRGVAVDTSGNVYIGDTVNHRVRKVTPAGIISTFAGTGNPGFSGDGGPATSARVGSPHGLVVLNGALYISNAGGSRFRSVDLTSNIITTYAGSSFGYDGDNHALLATEFTGPFFMLFDSSGNPVFDDAFNSRVRKAAGGIVNTIAGGYLGDGNKATAAALVFPEALAIDKSGNLYIADFTGNRVRKVSGGIISTIAGNGINGYTGDGGLGTSATLFAPEGVAVDSTGNVFVADTNNNVIREVNTTGTISTFATNPNFSFLLQMTTDAANNLYVTDNGACVIWKITPTAVVSIVAGVLNTCGYNGDGITATTAQLNGPYSVAVDTSGNLFIADNGNNRLREVNTSGLISTVAGNGICGYSGDGGSATAAEVCPNSVAIDKSGNVFVADNFTRIRKIRAGTITTFAGSGFGFNGDGLWPLYTAFDGPVAVAVDSKGAVYVLDEWDHRVRKVQ